MKYDFKTLSSILAKNEAGLSQVAIGDVREIVRCLGLMIREDKMWLEYLYDYSLKVRPERKALMACGKKKPKKPKK
jgi:hypothetical protein